MKKRLFPALLALVLALTMLSVGVFASTDPDTSGSGGGTGAGGTTTTTPAGTKDDPFKITATTVDGTKSQWGSGQTEGFLYLMDTGYYQLTADISPAMIMPANATVTIDLNGFDIVQSDAGGTNDQAVIYPYNCDVSIVNSNTGKSPTITSKATNVATIVVFATTAHTTTVEGVAIKNTNTNRSNSGCAIGVAPVQGGQAPANQTVTIKNCTIEDYNGISVNGLVGEGNTIDLDNVNITPNAEGTGLYLAGPATTTVKGGTIEGGSRGIEIRAGELNVQDGAVIKGGNGEPTSTGNNSGSTTTNAGIAVAQHTTVKPITVNIEDGAQVSGGAALYVTNPQQNTHTTVDQTVTVSGAGTTLTSTHTDPTTNATGDAVYAQAPVDIVIKEGAKLDGNVTMKKDDNNTGKGGVDITGATVDGDITNNSGDGAAVTVRQSTVTGTIAENVGVVSGCTDGNGQPIKETTSANANLKIESETTDAQLYAKVKISGMDTGKVYAIRLAKDQYKNNGEMTILIVDSVENYTIYCKDGQKIWVFEYDSKDVIVAGNSQHTTLVEGTATKTTAP